MRSTSIRVAMAALVVIGAVLAFVATRPDEEVDPFACRGEVLARPPELDEPPAVPTVVAEPVIEGPSISAIAPYRGTSVYAGARDGEILLVDVVAGTQVPVLDVGPLSQDREAGLQGLAVDPAGAFLYVTHTSASGHDNVLIEYPIDPAGAVDASAARVVLQMDSPHQHHNMSHLVFGPDGLLYVGVGDSGGEDGDRRADPSDVAQDLRSLRGKILRIDPRPSGGSPYTVPEDNPFVGTAGAAGEIYLVGFRNPWRFDFDAANGDLWIGDTGQFCADEYSRVSAEEIAGANLGWSGYEGFRAQRDDQQEQGTVAPVHAYSRGEGPDGIVRCAAIGGSVYRGSAIPALEGRYVYGDFCSGRLEVVDVVDGAVAAQVLTRVPEEQFIQTLGHTDDGELLVGTSEGLFVVAPGE